MLRSTTRLLSILGVTLAGLALWQIMLRLDNDRFSALAAGGLLIASLWICLARMHLPLLSPPLLYLSVFALFHLGMAVPWALRLHSQAMPHWFISNNLTLALGLVVLAISFYLAGILWGVRRRPEPLPTSIYINPALFSCGVMIYLAGCAMFFLGVHSLGGEVFFEAGYRETYRLAAQFDPRFFGTSFTVVPIGLYLAAASFPRRWKHLVFAMGLAWVAGIFYLGFRGFALIPGLVMLAILRQRGYRPSACVSLGLLALVLVAIPVARAVRDHGVRDRSLARSWDHIHPLDGVIEMGGSLRPLVHTITYVENEPWRWGKTYWQSLQTIWPNLALHWNGSPYIPLEDLPPNHWLTAQAEPDMYRHYGGLGFSAVAEPYLNFGTAGVMAYFFGLGALLAGTARVSSARPSSLALWAMILGPLLWTTRNGFEIFFRPAIWGILAVWLATTVGQAFLPAPRPVKMICAS